MKQYTYVGPSEFLKQLSEDSLGDVMDTLTDVFTCLKKIGEEPRSDGAVTLTFVVDLTGRLRLAPRRSEHVACAAGQPVLSAGEITFSGNFDAAKELEIIEISNQSTGFCPEPKSWSAVERALDQLGVSHPGQFTHRCEFRRCDSCGQRNLIKDDWFYCEMCDSPLPQSWNFA